VPSSVPVLVVAAVLAASSVSPATGQNQSPPADLPPATQAPSASQEQKAEDAPAQSPPAKNRGNNLSLNPTDIEQNMWANAKTYVDRPVSEVVRAVPDLKGLTPETSEEGLASLELGIA
jgi:hypothetical protein